MGGKSWSMVMDWNGVKLAGVEDLQTVVHKSQRDIFQVTGATAQIRFAHRNIASSGQ